MKRMICAGLLLATGCFTGLAQAGGDYLQGWGVAPQTRFYAGGSLGAANQGDYDDGSSTAGKLYGGVRYGRYLGAELGYTALGEAETKIQINDERVMPSLKSDTGGIYAAIMGYLPVAHRTEIFGKAGVMKWDSDYKIDYSQSDNDDNYEDSAEDDSGTSPLIGLGAQYHMNPNMFFRGEWERVMGTGDDVKETDIDILSVGITLSTY